MIWQEIVYAVFCLCILPNFVQTKPYKKGPTIEGIREVDNQCRKLGYGYACVNEHTCENLRCAYQGIFNLDAIGTFWSCQETGLAANEGSSCGIGFRCQSGICVAIPGWTSPIYEPRTNCRKRHLHSIDCTDSQPEDC